MAFGHLNISVLLARVGDGLCSEVGAWDICLDCVEDKRCFLKGVHRNGYIYIIKLSLFDGLSYI